ncbi:hypothetical protein PBI_PEREGRIN_201 [Rhodococcus phage Peregrin]|nr:hypothetical protein PBI_PEREGRIN_201 [Rhodococcus phage Peregrin]AWN04531.1 hypothetical protein PBI_GRAYSON_203 [Rhodococcus phage Grayson]
MMIAEGLLIALAAGAASVVSVIAKSRYDKYNAKFTHEENINEGLRNDLVRKESEITNLKKELRDAEDLLDLQRKNLWELEDSYMQLKILAKSILLRNGWTLEEVEITMSTGNPTRQVEIVNGEE